MAPADWASKAAWNKGGAHIPGADPQPPKKPFTPLYAFLASKQAALKALHPHLRPADLLARPLLSSSRIPQESQRHNDALLPACQALAKADAAEQWDKLSDEEHQLYVSMADGAQLSTSTECMHPLHATPGDSSRCRCLHVHT